MSGSLFPNKDILTKEEFESWTSLVDIMYSKEDHRESLKRTLNEC